MATSYYSTGTVSLTNGSAVVTGIGTGWQMALITNGFLFVEAPEGNPLPIASVDSDSQITAELEWTGATGTYSYALLRQTDQLQDNAENSRALSYLISEMRNGTLFKYDVAGTLADRAIYNERPKGFSYLVFAGTSAQLYVKASATSGDRAGPFAYGTGPVGPMGPMGFMTFRGTYNAGTAYARNDGVYHNGSSWVALQATTGNAPPNLPTTENVYWSLLAVKGQDGTGTGDVTLNGIQTLTNKTLTAPTLILKQSTAPVPTAEGDMQWDTDDDAIIVGTGASQKRFRGTEWETIDVASLGTVASYVRTGLAAFRTLRITGFLRTGLAGVIPRLQSSVDNGLSFESGASDYLNQSILSSGTAVASGGGSSQGASLGAADTEAYNSFATIFDEFNQPSQGFITTTFGGYRGVAGFSPGINFSVRNSSVARSAIRILFSAGNISSGRIVVEGIRG